MFADAELANLIYAQNREFFTSLGPACEKSGLNLGTPLIDTGTTIAFFGGEGNPITQANGKFTPSDIDTIMDFYRGRASWVEVLLTPYADPAAFDNLAKRGATLSGWESRLYRPVGTPLPEWDCPAEIRFEAITPDQRSLWQQISWHGFFGDELEEPIRMMNAIVEHAESIRGYLGYWHDRPVAAASVTLGQGCGVDFLGGMSTLPEFRRRGLQTAAIRRRLADLSPDAKVVTMGALPGSSSHRNAERAGFKIAYQELSLRLPLP